MPAKIACLTGGGDASGLNPAIAALVHSLNPEVKVTGILYGWKGLITEKPMLRPLNLKDVQEITRQAGTILGTSRENPLDSKETTKRVIQNLQNFDGLVVMGGDDTLGVADALSKQGVRVIGVPKTMDLDLSGTEYSVGFASYVESATELILGFIVTCKSHGRIGVCEVFGRHSGFTSATVGIATGADFIAIPEQELALHLLTQKLKVAYQDKGYALVVVSEGINIETGSRGKIDKHGNELLKERRIGEFLARQIEEMTGIETRAYQASHPHRGIPSAYDAIAGFRMGWKAAELVVKEQWGKMVAVVNGQFTSLPLSSFAPRRVIKPDSDLWRIVELRNNGEI